jgi:DNA-binding MarR family transcriptional regulator
VDESAAPPLFLQAWVAFLTAYARVVPRVSQELEAACGVSLAWYDVLFQLSLAPEHRRRMHELADAVLLSKSGLTRLVDRMEEGGLVARAPVAGDRRSLHVELTPDGRESVGKARQVVRRLAAEHFGQGLSDEELSTLRDALTRIARAATVPDRRPPS